MFKFGDEEAFDIVMGEGDSRFKVYPMEHRPVFGLIMSQQCMGYFCGMSMELDQAKELYSKLGAWINEYEQAPTL